MCMALLALDELSSDADVQAGTGLTRRAHGDVEARDAMTALSVHAFGEVQRRTRHGSSHLPREVFVIDGHAPSQAIDERHNEQPNRVDLHALLLELRAPTHRSSRAGGVQALLSVYARKSRVCARAWTPPSTMTVSKAPTSRTPQQSRSNSDPDSESDPVSEPTARAWRAKPD